MGLKEGFGKLAYGGAFMIGLPALLTAVAQRLDRSGWASWPVPLTGWPALLVLVVGSALMLRSMALLWTDGKGLPMNAYPTTRLVTRSSYRWLAHPIYTGFVLAVLGASGWLQSPTGFWLLAPLSALSAAALVIGYEGPRLRARFGAPAQAPLLGLPLPGLERPAFSVALGAAVTSLLPWATLYWALSHVPAPASATDLRMGWELSLPYPAWAVWVYSALYLVVPAVPFVLPTYSALRRWVRSAWLCTALGFLAVLVFPNSAAFLGQQYPDSATQLLNDLNRAADASWLAAPSFHAAWAVLAASALTVRWPAARLWAGLAAALVCASCVLTGSHALVDVVAGATLAWLCWQHEFVWRQLVRFAERLGNSWSSVRVGPMRVISHSLWSFAGAAVGTFVALWLAGSASLHATTAIVAVGLLGAGAWGHWLEGGGRLSRPFGYYGYLFGSLVAMAIFWFIEPAVAEPLMAAYAAGAPFAQALGRLRCVVQGCCHGRPVFAAYGMTVTHPMSRVTSLGNLCGKPIHPTPLYSVVGNVVLGLLLLRLWHAGAPWTLIAGLYLVLSSLARFAEEHYRGEPQTKLVTGLPVYQWLAIGLFVAGLVVCALPGAAVTSQQWVDPTGVAVALGAGLVAAFLMSVDFPNSVRRFSRLTVAR